MTVRNVLGVAILGLAWVGIGCDARTGKSPTGGQAGPGSQGSGQDVAFAVIEEGAFTQHPLGVPGGELVIRDDAAWTQLWRQHDPGRMPLVFDFATQQALAVFQGEQPTGGYAIEVQRVRRDAAGDLDVEVVLREPAAGQPVPLMFTRPFQFVATAATQGAVRFRRLHGLAVDSIDRGAISYYQYGNAQFAGEVRVITDAASFLAFWQDHVQGIIPPPAAPAVDFTQQMVAVALQGFRSSSGYGISFVDAQIDRATGELVLVVEENEVPGMLTVITNPYDIALLPRTAFRSVTVRRNTVVPFTTIDQGAYSGYRYGDPSFAGEARAVTTDVAWQQAWADHTSNVLPPPALPVTDFTQEAVLCAWQGYCSTGGYAIEVSKVLRNWRGETEVTLTRQVPGGIVTQAITNPFHFVRTARITGPVVFR